MPLRKEEHSLHREGLQAGRVSSSRACSGCPACSAGTIGNARQNHRAR